MAAVVKKQKQRRDQIALVPRHQQHGITDAIKKYADSRKRTFQIDTQRWNKSPLIIHMGPWQLIPHAGGVGDGDKTPSPAHRKEAIEIDLVRVFGGCGGGGAMFDGDDDDDMHKAVRMCLRKMATHAISSAIALEHTTTSESSSGATAQAERTRWAHEAKHWRIAREATMSDGKRRYISPHEWKRYQAMKLNDQFASKQENFNEACAKAKVYQNAMLLKYLIISMSGQDKNGVGGQQHAAFALDGRSAFTSLCLKLGGCAMHVANLDSDIDQSNCTLHRMSAAEYFRDLPQAKHNNADSTMVFRLAALDYCCTLGGADCGPRPRADIQLFFARHLLAMDGGIFSCTFCLRGVGTVQEKCWDIYNCVTSKAARFGYDLVLVNDAEHGQYYGGGNSAQMAFMLFRSIPIVRSGAAGGVHHTTAALPAVNPRALPANFSFSQITAF